VSAFSEAQKLYESKELGHIIATCANDGFIYAEPDVFVCAYPIYSNDIETQYDLELDRKDTWFIFIASGDLTEAFNVIPKKDYIAFERFDGKVRIYEFERFRRIYGKRNG
jgi:hypothetical protein